MRRGPVLLACLGALLMLVLPAAAQAKQPRIINGQPASQGEYPAQGLLVVDPPGPGSTGLCGGSLISNRYFITAGHCATQGDTPLPASSFTVTLGKVDTNTFTPSDEYTVVENRVHEEYADSGPHNDVAVLTLDRPAPARLEPLRLIDEAEAELWAPGRAARVIGWGVTENDTTSDVLLEATVPMVSDASCNTAWGLNFVATWMVCAGGGSTDSCNGDSGGPMMVSDGAFLVLAGLVSWGADPCAQPGAPGVYTRIGEPALNRWVRDRVPTARARVSNAAPQPGEAVTLTAAARNPVGSGFTGFAWDFDSNGTTDATGATVTHAYPSAGAFTARVLATGSGADTAAAKVRVNVATPPPPPPPVIAPPVVSGPAASGPVARILASGRPKVSKRGRFRIRVNFAATAPAGTAVIEVFRGKRKIGSAKTGVRRGGSKRVSVKLNKTGRRLLRRAESKRLKVRIRVRVGSRVLRTSTLTIRR